MRANIISVARFVSTLSTILLNRCFRLTMKEASLQTYKHTYIELELTV